MAKVITTENPSVDARRYLRHWASEDFVEPRLRAKHPGLSRERARTKARQVSVQIKQGLEFLEAADGASLLTKPLTLFYAAENLAKGMCIFLDEPSDLSMYAHHGLVSDRDTKRYFIRKLSCQVGKAGTNVWTNLFRVFNADRSQLAITEDGTALRREQVMQHPTPKLPFKTTLELGWLLRHLPEIADDVVMAGWDQPFVVHCMEFRITTASGPPVTHSAQFMLRHGHEPRIKDMIVAQERGLLRGYQRLRDTLDVIEYEHGPTQSLPMPVARLDVFGELYMDFYGGQRDMGELVVYFAALFILSDGVRYQADQWLRLLDSHPAEAILIERFSDIAVRKLPNLVLNELHGELFKFQFAR